MTSPPTLWGEKRLDFDYDGVSRFVRMIPPSDYLLHNLLYQRMDIYYANQERIIFCQTSIELSSLGRIFPKKETVLPWMNKFIFSIVQTVDRIAATQQLEQSRKSTEEYVHFMKPDTSMTKATLPADGSTCYSDFAGTNGWKPLELALATAASAVPPPIRKQQPRIAASEAKRKQQPRSPASKPLPPKGKKIPRSRSSKPPPPKQKQQPQSSASKPRPPLRKKIPRSPSSKLPPPKRKQQPQSPASKPLSPKRKKQSAPEVPPPKRRRLPIQTAASDVPEETRKQKDKKQKRQTPASPPCSTDFSAHLGPFVNDYISSTSEKVKMDVLWTILRSAHEAFPFAFLTAAFDKIAGQLNKAPVAITHFGEKDIWVGGKGMHAFHQLVDPFVKGYGNCVGNLEKESFIHDIFLKLQRERFRFLEQAGKEEGAPFKEIYMESSCLKIRKRILYLQKKQASTATESKGSKKVAMKTESPQTGMKTTELPPAAPTETESPAASTGTESPAAPTGTESPAAPTRTESPAAPTRTESPTAPTGTESPAAPTGTGSSGIMPYLRMKIRRMIANVPEATESPAAPTGTESPSASAGTESPAAPTNWN